ncbi:MAG: helix-turn-helix domain-containing protein [Bifidobacteriaceae bacterium]|jgi:hypothetical protein|nr:helix-turn-helix domain-containing protein [Bifidobacteriaceae bacterium]
MLTVAAEPAVVEALLAVCWLCCPDAACQGTLRPWGWARPRVVEAGLDGRGSHRVRPVPRRARCDACRRTHVLLPDGFLSRRADSGAVIGRAVELAAAGHGHRKIAAALGRPASTVRGWLRSARAAAAAGTGALRAVAAQVAPDAAAVNPKPAGTPLGDLVAALSALAAAAGARERRQETAPWHSAGAAACRCRLFQASWWAGTAQHELALTPAWLARAGSARGP